MINRPADNAPKLFIVAPTPTPYWTHFFERIERELYPGGVEVAYTHDRSPKSLQAQSSEADQQRDDQRKEDTYIHERSNGESADDEASSSVGPIKSLTIRRVTGDWERGLHAYTREWRDGERLIRWCAASRPQCVLVLGYQDPARWRLIRWCHRQALSVLAWSDVNAFGDQPSGTRLLAKMQYMRWLDRHLSGWLICGSRGRDYLDRYQINAAKVFTVPVEPDYEEIVEAVSKSAEENLSACDQQEPLEIRQHSSNTFPSDRRESAGQRRILCSGRMVATKRFDLAIRSFAAVAADRPEWDLLLVGDGPLRPKLEAMVPTDLTDRVIFTGQIIRPAELWNVYRTCDVLLHVPDHEPWGLVINEAACLGMAIVCSNAVGAGVELVRNKVNGRVVLTGDRPAICRALLDVTEEGNLARFKAASLTMLTRWRTTADQIGGLRAALAFARRTSEGQSVGD